MARSAGDIGAGLPGRFPGGFPDTSARPSRGRMREGPVPMCSGVSKQRNPRSTNVTPKAMPSITHVAVTVTDLEASEAWYTKVLGVEPVLDEDTGPFRHIVYAVGGTLLGLHGFPDLVTKDAVRRAAPRARPHRLRLRQPQRAGRVGQAPRRAGHRARPDQGRRLRLGSVVPRPGQHRPRALRPAGHLIHSAGQRPGHAMRDRAAAPRLARGGGRRSSASIHVTQPSGNRTLR